MVLFDRNNDAEFEEIEGLGLEAFVARGFPDAASWSDDFENYSW